MNHLIMNQPPTRSALLHFKLWRKNRLMSSFWCTGTDQSLKHGSQFDFFTLGCPFRYSREEKWGIHLRPNSQPGKVE